MLNFFKKNIFKINLKNVLIFMVFCATIIWFMRIVNVQKIPKDDIKMLCDNFLIFLKSDNLDSLYSKYAKDFKLSNGKFIKHMQKVNTIFGKLTDYRLVGIKKLGEDQFGSTNSCVAVYYLKFNDEKEYRSLFEIQEVTTSCLEIKITGIDINPAGKSNKNFSIRFLGNGLK
jgi:hypothetical protein